MQAGAMVWSGEGRQDDLSTVIYILLMFRKERLDLKKRQCICEDCNKNIQGRRHISRVTLLHTQSALLLSFINLFFYISENACLRNSRPADDINITQTFSIVPKASPAAGIKKHI